MSYLTISSIKADNPMFFNKSGMQFFNSRIGKIVYPGGYFITSEQFYDSRPRLYTVRRAVEGEGITTIGNFQAYTTIAKAVSAIKKLA